MAQINTERFLDKSSQKCADVDFEMDDEFAGFLEQLEAIPIELADENCANSCVEDTKTENLGALSTIIETNNVLQKETSEEKKKELSILSDSLESGECCSSECDSLDSKAGLLKGRSLYQQVLEFKAQRAKNMHKHELYSAEINEKDDLILPGKARNRKDSSSSYSSSLSGKETIILPLNENLPLTTSHETDLMEEKLKSRKLAASPSLEFEDRLNSNSLLKENTLSSFHKLVKQEMLLLENKLSPISSQSGLVDVDNLLKISETMKYSTKSKNLFEDKNTSLVSIVQSVSASVLTKMEFKTELNESSKDCKAEISRKSPSFSPISNSSSGKLEKKKDVLSLSSISPPTDENDSSMALNLNAISSKSLIWQRELKDYGSLSPVHSDVTKRTSSKEKVAKKVKKKKKKSKRKTRSKSKFRENAKTLGERKTYIRSPERQRTRSKSKSLPLKKEQRHSSRSLERHSSRSIERNSSRSIERPSKSRSRSIERTAKRRRRSFSRSQSRSRSLEKGSRERQRQYYKRSRSRSYEKGAYKNQSYRRSPAPRRSRSGSVERQVVKRQRWYRKRSRSRSRSLGRRTIKRSSRSKSRSPYNRICRSPKRKRSSSKTPPGLRRNTSSSMSISPLTSDENTNFTSVPAVSEEQASLPCADVNSLFSQPQPIPSVVGHVVQPPPGHIVQPPPGYVVQPPPGHLEQPPPSMGNHNNYYDNYCCSQDVPYAYPSNMQMSEPQLPYYHPPEQNYWNPESSLQDNYGYNRQPHYNRQTNLRDVLLSVLPPLPPPPLPSHPPLPPLPPLEPAPPPPPPPPEADNTFMLTPEKAKPSKLISRLKSNLRYILPEITKKVHSEEVVKLIDRSLKSPLKASPSVSSSSSSVGEEIPKDKKVQAEKCILEKLQEATFENISSKDHKPSSGPDERQPSQVPSWHNTSSKKAYDNKNNNSVTVETQMIPSIASEQDTATKQNKAYAILKPKSNSKYSPVVLKLLPRQKLVPNSHFIDTEDDEEATECNINEQRVIKHTPFQPGFSPSRPSLIHINTSGILPSKEKYEQGCPADMGMKMCPPGLAKDNSIVFAFPKENKQKNNLAINSKEAEFIKGASFVCNSIKDDKSKSLHPITNAVLPSDNGNAALKNKTENVQDKCKNDYKNKDFKSHTLTETGVTSKNAGKDIHQGEHMTAFINDAIQMLNVSNKAESKIKSYCSSQSSDSLCKGNSFPATITRETNMFGNGKHKSVIEKVFGANLGGIGTIASAAVSDSVTKVETEVKYGAAAYASSNNSSITNATTTQTNIISNGIAKEISKSTIQGVYGENLGCSVTSVGANTSTKAETRIKSENTSQNSESVLKNITNSTVNPVESVTCKLKAEKEVPVNDQVENETSEPRIEGVSENNFSNALHKEEMKVTTEVSDEKKQNSQHKINSKSKHTAEVKLLPPVNNDGQMQVRHLNTKTIDSIPDGLNKESQEESNTFVNKKEELTNKNVAKDAKPVKWKTETCKQQLSKFDYMKDLKQNSIKNPHSESSTQIKQEKCVSTETCYPVEVSRQKQATTTDAAISQNFHKNEKVTSLEVTDLKKVANEVVVPAVSHKATEQGRGAIDAQGKNNNIYKLVSDLPAVTKVKTKASSSAETKLSLSKHKSKSVIEHQSVSKVDSLSTTQNMKPVVKAKEQQKRTDGDSPCLNSENSQHRSLFFKSANFSEDAVSSSVSSLTLSNHHKSNALGKKYKHRWYDKEQTSLLPLESNETGKKQNITESTSVIAVSENMDVDTTEREKSTKIPETLDASEERKNQFDNVDSGTKEAGDKLGESSIDKGYDMEDVDITYKKQQRKKKEQSTTVRAATVNFDRRKQIWEDPKLNMNVKIQLERCKAEVGMLNLAVKDHTSQTIIKTEQPQDENVEVDDKISSSTETSLSAHTTVAACASKNTKDFAFEENKAKDPPRKSKSKVTEDTLSVVQNLSKSMSKQGSLKEESKDFSELKAVCDKKSKISALEKVISLLTVSRRNVSTQVRYKAKTLQGTHEVKGHRAPLGMDSAIISSLKELLNECKSGT